VADLNYYDAIQMKWLPPKSKLIEVYSTNVSALTINPRIGYRHKLLNVWINGLNPTTTSLTREAIDIVLGPKTLVRWPAWLWGNYITSIVGMGGTYRSSGVPEFLGTYILKGVLDLLPDAAADEPLTLSAVSGTSYSAIDAMYVEYPSDQAMAHDVPGGSDYWRKYFFAWFYLFSTTVENGQQLSEYGEPFGMQLLGENGRMPPNKTFHQLGILSGYPNANQNSSITNYTVYNALHEWLNDEELFTPDTHTGLYINQQSAGYLTDTTFAVNFEPKRMVDFNPNDLLALYADVTSVTGTGSPLWVTIDGVLEDLSKKPATAGGPRRGDHEWRRKFCTSGP